MNRLALLAALVLVSVTAVIISFRSASDGSSSAVASDVVRQQNGGPSAGWKDAKLSSHLALLADAAARAQAPGSSAR